MQCNAMQYTVHSVAVLIYLDAFKCGPVHTPNIIIVLECCARDNTRQLERVLKRIEMSLHVV